MFHVATSPEGLTSARLGLAHTASIAKDTTVTTVARFEKYIHTFGPEAAPKSEYRLANTVLTSPSNARLSGMGGLKSVEVPRF